MTARRTNVQLFLRAVLPFPNIPAPLRPGGTVGIIAPSSAPQEAQRYADGLAALESVYEVRRIYRHGPPHGYLSAPDADRLRDLNAALADPGLDAVLVARGGYGCLRLLSGVNYAAAVPKWIVGYSDTTALQMALYRRKGWASLSGPVVTEWPVMDEAMRDAFVSVAGHAEDAGGRVPLTEMGGERLRPVAAGEAHGPLVGGNLSVLTRLIGTPYAPGVDGAILVIEDVDEKPYAVDRMLAHLDLAGVLDAVAGVAIGTISTGGQDPGRPTHAVDAIVEDYFAGRPYPVAAGLPYGHRLTRLTLPLGLPATLRVTQGEASLEATFPADRTPA